MSEHTKRIRLMGTAILAVAAATTTARADETTDKSAAEALFRAGRSAMEAGRYADACPKLAESQRLDPAAGTLMNLGECYAKNGQTASAWVTFAEAARAAAARRREDWRATATARAHELESQLAMLVIEIERRQPGLTVTRDGSAVGEPQWSAAVPVDPGTHTIVAEAPNHASWRSAVEVPPGPRRIVVKVPPLADAEPPVAAAAAPAVLADGHPQTRRSDPLKPIGIAAIATGSAALVATVVTGLMASAAATDADRLCPSSPCADAAGLDANDRAHTFATVSTVTAVAGVALVAGGIAMLLWPRSTSSPARRTFRPFFFGATF